MCKRIGTPSKTKLSQVVCRASSTNKRELRPWDDLAFERVFIDERDALVWWVHHNAVGPPEQPFHYLPYQDRLRKQAHKLIKDDADFLGALKLLAQAAKAGGDVSSAVQLGRFGIL